METERSTKIKLLRCLSLYLVVLTVPIHVTVTVARLTIVLQFFSIWQFTDETRLFYLPSQVSVTELVGSKGWQESSHDEYRAFSGLSPPSRDRRQRRRMSTVSVGARIVSRRIRKLKKPQSLSTLFELPFRLIASHGRLVSSIDHSPVLPFFLSRSSFFLPSVVCKSEKRWSIVLAFPRSFVISRRLAVPEKRGGWSRPGYEEKG